MTFEIFIANADAGRVAQIGQRLGLSGTIIRDALGFGEWGVEPTIIARIGQTSSERAMDFVDGVFAAFPNEKAVWVECEDFEELWYREGGGG